MHATTRDLKLSIDYHTYIDFTYTQTSRVAFLVIFFNQTNVKKKARNKNLISEKERRVNIAYRQIYARLL